jgi:hypothetical protein
MNLSRIAADKPLSAQIWQSGWIDEANKLIATVPQPFGIVSLAIDRTIDTAGTSDLVPQRSFLFEQTLADSAEGLLSDAQLTRLASTLVSYMDKGFNLHIHCISGQSRSSYIPGAVLSTALGIPGSESTALIFRDRPGARENMQPSFQDHLKRLFPG